MCLLLADLWGPWSGISCATPHWSFEKEKRGRKKIKGQSSTMFYSLSLSAVLTVSCAFSKRNVRPDVCVLCSPTQISLVPDLGFLFSCMGMPECNTFSVCEQERNSLFFERLGNERSGKVGQSGKIRVIGCKGRTILGLQLEKNSRWLFYCSSELLYRQGTKVWVTTWIRISLLVFFLSAKGQKVLNFSHIYILWFDMFVWVYLELEK